MKTLKKEKPKRGLKFRAIAFPATSVGTSFKDVKKAVIPDQSIGLEKLLKRFTRGESMPVLHQGNYGVVGNYDLEKMKFLDPVERGEIIESMKFIESKFKKQKDAEEAAQKEAAEKKALEDYDKKVRIAARKIAKLKGGSPQS